HACGVGAVAVRDVVDHQCACGVRPGADGVDQLVGVHQELSRFWVRRAAEMSGNRVGQRKQLLVVYTQVVAGWAVDAGAGDGLAKVRCHAASSWMLWMMVVVRSRIRLSRAKVMSANAVVRLSLWALRSSSCNSTAATRLCAALRSLTVVWQQRCGSVISH